MRHLFVLAALCGALAGCGDDTTVTCSGSQPDMCSGLCVNTNNDHNNCGGCGNVCTSTQTCNSGDCVTPCTPEAEVCDGIDNDCDGSIDENVVRDCTNSCGAGTQTCNDSVWGACSAAPTTEICNGLDDDCDGTVDEGVATTYYRDADGDLHGDPLTTITACTQPAGYVATPHDDCNDIAGAGANIHPGATELCTNSVDDDCDGAINEGCTCTVGAHQTCGAGGDVGACEFGDQVCADLGSGAAWQACTGGVRPTAELCDTLDNDCDGTADEGIAEDGLEITGTTWTNNDTCAQSHPLADSEQAAGSITITPTSYSSDGSVDVDWYVVNAVEMSDLGCALNPFARQCYFYYTLVFTPPTGSTYTNYRMTLYNYATGSECGTPDFTYATTSSDWYAADGAYIIMPSWEGTCWVDDSWTFYVKIERTGGSSTCRPYSLEYNFDFSGGIGDSFCT